jgi:hypothetical protein
MDVDGNIVAEQLDMATRITNQPLRYLAYSSFTAVKHGYPGKKKRIPFSLCVQTGIQDNFPD